MKENEIIERINKIKKITKQKKLDPPVDLVLTKDGIYILKEYYDEYLNLLKKLEELKKPYTDEDQKKYDQLMYIKDKMDYMKEKAKKSNNKISLLETDIEEYVECKKTYDKLYEELLPVLKYFDTTKEEKEIVQNIDEKKQEEVEEIIDATVQMPVVTINKMEEEKNEIVPKVNSNKLLQDLADIDKLLNFASEYSNDIKIGDIIIPMEDTTSYNNTEIKAIRGTKYKVISLVSLDENNKVINSSNLESESLNTFKEKNKNNINLFVISSVDDEKRTIGSFSNIEKFKKES